MIRQIVGGICFFIGLLIVIGFPGITKYQPEAMGKTGIIIGIGLMIFGFYLMKA